MQQKPAKRDRIQSLSPQRDSFGRQFRRLLRKWRARLASIFLRMAFRVARAGTKPYEPIEIGGHTYQNTRESENRWKAIATVLKEYDARNVLDVGCAEGWFLRRAATDLNCFALGIEASERVLISELARLHDGLERTAMMTAFVSADDILALPKFDAVICTSLVHHVIKTRRSNCREGFSTRSRGAYEQSIVVRDGDPGRKGLVEHFAADGKWTRSLHSKST